VAFELETRPADQHGEKRRQHSARHHADPRRDAELDEQDRGGIGAEPVKRPGPKQNLPPETPKKVQAHRHRAVHHCRMRKFCREGLLTSQGMAQAAASTAMLTARLFTRALAALEGAAAPPANKGAIPAPA